MSSTGTTASAPGGTGALRVAGDLIFSTLGQRTVWLSEPTWPNHPQMFAAAGFKIEPDQYQPVPGQYLRAPVAVVKVSGESLAIWEYPNPGAAADDGQRVSPRGIDGGFHELGSEAKWFLRGRLLVLYLGAEPELQALLEQTLGPIFVRGKAA